MQSKIQYAVDQKVATISLDNGPVNTLGFKLRKDLAKAFDQALSDPNVEAIVIDSAAKTFCAGADITEFGSSDSFAEPSLPHICNLIDTSPKLVVAAIHGVALGGGLEIALAADLRIAVPKSSFGLPEVRLGIIPGAGGTQRLPRVVGVKAALDMVATAKTLSSAEALDLGLVDVLHDIGKSEAKGEVASSKILRQAAVELALANIDKGYIVNMFNDNSFTGSASPDVFDQFIAKHDRKWKGFVAPYACVKAIRAATQHNLEQGLKIESELFQECQSTFQARAQQHVFFAEREALKVPGVDKGTAILPIHKVGVIGSGTMGSGIAINFLLAGFNVTLLDMSDEALARGEKYIHGVLDGNVLKGRCSQYKCDQAKSLLTTSTEYSDLSGVELVVEAVFENMDVKKTVVQKLDAVLNGGAIIASNTSTLDLDELALVSRHPERVIGLHFFSPANVMRLVEVIRGVQTSPEVLATCLSLAKTIGKLPVTVGVCYGFVGNRMVAPYSREGFRMLLEGARPSDVDTALRNFGMAMGVIEMADMAGIDVACMAALANKEQWQDDKSYQALQFKLREENRLGQKTSAGVYNYIGGTKQEAPETSAMINEISVSLDIEQSPVSAEDIVERCILSLVNEGARILEEGIAYRSGDIDLIYLNGYGFPAWRGGPMQYADEMGLNNVVTALLKHRNDLGEYGGRWFEPAPLLLELAAAGKSFKDYKVCNVG